MEKDIEREKIVLVKTEERKEYASNQELYDHIYAFI